LENWSPRRGGRLREVVATGGSTVFTPQCDEYPRIFPSFSWGIFGHVTCIDQSRASENI